MPVAIVTGAASGLGAACAASLGAEGVAVAGLDLRPADGCACSLVVDVRDAAAVESAFAEVEQSLGAVDYAVTAAGYYERRPLLEFDEDAWRSMLAVLLDGTTNVCRSAYRRMLQRGHGRICTVSSELSFIGDADAAHYAAAKGAINAFTKTLALEAAPYGVQVNGVAPGPADTPLMTPELRDPAYIDSLVLKRLVAPQEVAAAVCWLLLDEHNMCGQLVSPNAGAVI
jgi:NAD(P)-dependent dehydrogenase (short-subunit alcohol dehydrogenase family)